VIGILAARIRERCHRPVIAFAPGEELGLIKGSARSVAGLHIRDVLDAVAASKPHLLQKFGGHAMAAGLSLQLADLDAFSREFDLEVRRRIDSESLCGVVRSDGDLEAGDLQLDLAEQLRAAGPWGQGFSEPIFDGVFSVLQRRVVAEKHLKLVLQPQEGGDILDAIAFNQADRTVAVNSTIHAAFRMDINEYRGSCSLQLMVEYFTATPE
jgi:single-stranded-DNA-specific exonuclease